MHPTRRTRIPPKGLQSPLEGPAPHTDTGANKGSICRCNMLDFLLKVSPLRARERGPFTQVTLLWSSGAAPGGDVDLGFRPGGRGTGVARDQHAVDLPGHVALEAADDLSLALALRGATRATYS